LFGQIMVRHIDAFLCREVERLSRFDLQGGNNGVLSHQIGQHVISQIPRQIRDGNGPTPGSTSRPERADAAFVRHS
jgi:hypothetical protein